MDLVKIIQWNCKSLFQRKPEVIHLIREHNPVILAISETWLKPGIRFRVPGFTCLRDDRNDGYAGSAFLIIRLFPFSRVSLPSHSPNFNVVAVKAFDITFVSFYIPHPDSSLGADIRSILSSLPRPLIVLGDFNSHHTAWGCHHCDSFALQLLDIFDDANVCFINDGSPTRRVYPQQNPKSAVDLTLCSPCLAPSLNWEVLSSSFGIDHFPIIVTLCNKSSPLLFQPL